MDKETLSNYGWITIVTLVLAVMLCLATPFGTYIGDGVISISRAFVATSDKTTDEKNVEGLSNKFDDRLRNYKIIGKFTAQDNSYFYVFNEDGTGYLQAGTSYKFKYELNNHILKIDFENNSIGDSTYEIAFTKTGIILTAGQGMVTVGSKYELYKQ